MPLRTIKQNTAEALTLEWVLQVKDYKLAVDKNYCVGCQICSLACPKEAIKVEKQPKTAGQKAEKAKIDVDLAKCNFCGICDLACPYGAMKVTVDGQHVLSVVEKESFPQLIRDIQVNSARLQGNAMECEDACPLDLIKTKWQTADGKAVDDLSALTEQERQGVHVQVEIDKEHCPCCRVCEFKCSEGLIRVRKFLSGKIDIHNEKCPEGCTDCLDVCPITGALYLSESDKKVHPNENFCVYCGACKVVCPVNEALELKRTGINHTPVRSGAWNKALERMASPIIVAKELKSKRSLKA
ncbi:MAG TPA: 4Fe-4S dicluster domain-containing protein, partial [Candidatus Acidoferrum sp.]|nr:4Fe-4S dicluster domain-containing protein [Candidatus Acidoferrum sp.]